VFTPRWKKEALLWLKGSQKFVHYKRDLLEPGRIDEIESRRKDLKEAIKAKDLDRVKETSKQLRNTCDKSLAHYQAPNWLEENIEVFWVMIVILLGIRAYVLQPFRIPTNSMKPALNGIIMTDKSSEEGWESPWFGKQIFDYAWSGVSYSNVVAERDLTVAKIEDATKFIFSRTKITFTDGTSISISAPPSAVQDIATVKDATYLLNSRGDRVRPKRGPHFKKGDPIFVGTRRTGDLVFVNKFAYHFRKPKRGEAFVFDTIGLKTDPNGGDQAGGSHYIKRLVAVPGDEIQVKAPDLYINGELAKEETIRRVATSKDGFPGYRNMGHSRSGVGDFRDPKNTYTLQTKEDPNFNEYFAFGDNSPNSSDSRMWGTVKQYNLIGPGFISLWPFGSGHWGFIE